ncbi:sugar dehydrogenase complex small subunit [Robbsia sp. Bb-Pol-6]|uniref:Sugar dehydrogenase complex small subunit n=1 Tax=Robbsia betulipollinis TaxID=2981849 RepID=A0ABT3ZS59_9BURK|nr:sugar dehydrogenase complex small subunit [Robbsia betulipollinis]MCY0389399.1 sugar dehydrogenase complex small subunit [Robbsia betulipollinis]
MRNSDNATVRTGAPNAIRRGLLGGLFFSYVASFYPWSEAGAQGTPASAAPASARAVAPPAFLRVSRLLTGRAALDAAQADRLHAGLLAAQSDFPAYLRDLDTFIVEHAATAGNLQMLLDAARVPYAKLPRQIAIAWYVGVVGTGAGARCVTYETSLMNVVVADQLTPASYAYGPYGSWARPPRGA